jgi:hypothetical protein
VWEVLRKDGKSGSVGLANVYEKDRVTQLSYLKEVLPLLLAPSPAVTFHVSHALSTIAPPGTEASASVQLRALTYAVRWEAGPDFLASPSEGDRWLVWAASSVRGSTLKSSFFSILTDDRRRLKSHRLLFYWRKLPILVHEGTPSDEPRFGTSLLRIGWRNLGLCV